MINLFKVWMAPDVDLNPVLHSGYIGEGPQTKLFEEQVGKLIKNDNVVVLNSGTSAITLALKLAGVGHGDKVVSTPMNCLAGNMAILSVGAIPVWADILPDGTIDPEDVKRKIKGAKAVVCMDWGGKPCMLRELALIRREFGTPIIEDACQALGATYFAEPVGSHADFVAFSTQAIKILTTVDGGFLAINSPHPLLAKSYADKARMMRWFGLDRNQGADMRCNQDPPVAGYKMQMNDVLATIGLANLSGLEQRLQKTRDNADYLNKKLRIPSDEYRISSNWLYTIFVEDNEDFIHYMKENGIEASRVHDRNDTKTVFKESCAELPGVDWFDSHHVCIPCGWWVTQEELDYIINIIFCYRLQCKKYNLEFLT